jgi:hypothetical protein
MIIDQVDADPAFRLRKEAIEYAKTHFAAQIELIWKTSKRKRCINC